jgi:predicted DNA-binding protein (MmcQ/YjbR family)
VNREAVRKFALSLPGATEEPHFHFTSFRLKGKIFATMPPEKALLHVFVPEAEREVSIAAFPDCCESLHWGKRVVGVRIDLERASSELVRELLTAAHGAKAGSGGS